MLLTAVQDLGCRSLIDIAQNSPMAGKWPLVMDLKVVVVKLCSPALKIGVNLEGHWIETSPLFQSSTRTWEAPKDGG